MASASAESSCGSSGRPKTRCIILRIWSFVAAPVPVTARFTRAGGYSCIGRPRRAHAATTTPRAWPRMSEVRAFLQKKMPSIAISSGRNSSR